MDENSVYEYKTNRYDACAQLCPVCKGEIGLMPGSRDAVCHNCGFKDPCCE